MAYEQIQRIGKGEASKLTLYKFTSDATYIRPYGYFTRDVFNSLYDSLGVNVCSLLRDSASVGAIYDLFTLGKDHKLCLYIASGGNNYNTDGWTHDLWNINIQIRLKANNTLVNEFVFAPLYTKATKNGVERIGEMFLNGCVDEEGNTIFLRSLHTPASNVGINNFGLENIDISARLGGVNLYNYINGNYDLPDSDPWSGGGYATIGGGGGTFNFTSDIINLPTLPTVDATSSGFLQMFSGSLSNIVNLSKYMWSTDFFDSLVKITDNPIDIIMGLYMYPFPVPVSGYKKIRAGNVITPIEMGVPSSQLFELDCGNFTVPNFYGAYLDYEPFTKCEVFLPYCGTFSLSMDDIAGKTINVKYRVDLLTGTCCAFVIVDDIVKYNFTGACAINIPISSRSFENVYNSVMGIVGNAFSKGYFSLPSIGSIAGAVTSGKNQIQHGGNVSGNSGYLGVQKPYLIFSVPNVAIPKGQNKYTGYPLFATFKLDKLKGYTEIEEIHLEKMGSATSEELDKIVSLLKGGVIL